MEEEKDVKRKFPLWIYPSLLAEVDSLYKTDNCSSRTEFMEKAIRFYIGYVTSGNAQDYLANVIPSAVKGIVDESANRMGRLLFKIAVYMAVVEKIVPHVGQVEEVEVKRLRAPWVK